MPEKPQLHHPWLVAVWPGMGHVALNAGVYLLAKLSMNLIAEFEANDLFDVDQVEVKEGIIQAGPRPRNRLFVWKDPKEKHDLVVFLGEAQPPMGRYAFCRQLITHARQLHPSLYDKESLRVSETGVGYLMPIFSNAIGPEDLECVRHSIFKIGNLTQPYHSVNVDINKRIRFLG